METESTSSATTFNPGDLIWAKMKGFPPWPAKVLEQSEDTPVRRIPVMFYGTLEKSFMKPSDLFSYLEHRAEFEIPRKQKDFNKAVQEIRIEAGLSQSTDLGFPSIEEMEKTKPALPNQGRTRTSSSRLDAILNGEIGDEDRKRKRSNSNSTRSRSRTSSTAPGFRHLKEAMRERKRLDSESSNGSKRKKMGMISGGIPYAPELVDHFGGEDLSALLGDDFIFTAGASNALPEENRSWRSKRSRASSRIFEDLFGHQRTRNRSGSASASGRRSRLISMSGFSGVSDYFEELFAAPADLDAHAEQLMITLNNMPSEGSIDRPITPELPNRLLSKVEFCQTCGQECREVNGVWKCTGKYCSKYKEVAAASSMDGVFDKLDVPLLAVKTEPSGVFEVEPSGALSTNETLKAMVKRELSSPTPTPRASVRVSKPIKKEVSLGYEDDEQASPPRSSLKGSRPVEKEKKRKRVNVVSPKLHSNPADDQMPSSGGFLSPRKAVRPKHYKVEKTPPISSSGHRHCVFCNGQVRPQMCGGNRHRWRCVDKKCRKWYGWVRSHEEIPKNVGRKSSKYLQLKSLKPKREEVSEEPAIQEYPFKRKVGRPSKNDIKIRLKLQREASQKRSPPPSQLNGAKRKYTKRKGKFDGSAPGTSGLENVEEEKKRPVSPLTNKQSRFRPSAMEKRARWWTGEKRRVDISPERELGTTPADSAAAFRLMAHAVRSAAVTRADEMGTVNGTLDLLMDSLLGSMGPLLSMFQKLPLMRMQPETASEIWNASAVHLPMFQ
ncbi:unnamed protein product [Caenorhabditis auriculariae]|uniref:PWWP domain-containing protein n=1 Tax=Caenorhabditis auriculariae TaxID=2777116 RepID=A0A8S1GP85_9PELO|nr:unnamed protein product [Caenorhabditis auriculariae]